MASLYSKRHYLDALDLLQSFIDSEPYCTKHIINRLALAMADRFEADNSSFNRHKFLAAADKIDR